MVGVDDRGALENRREHIGCRGFESLPLRCFLEAIILFWNIPIWNVLFH